MSSMKIGGLARRKHTKQVSKLNHDIKAINSSNKSRQHDSPKIKVHPDKINDTNNIILEN